MSNDSITKVDGRITSSREAYSRAAEEEKVMTIDLTPSWIGLADHMMLVLETSDNPSARTNIREAFYQMALSADMAVAMQKEN